MRLSFVFLITCLLINIVKGQQLDCPPNYEERTVKCKNNFVQRCIPINYKCVLCWKISFPSKSGGSPDIWNDDTYEQALKKADYFQRTPNSGLRQNDKYNYTTVKIYMEDEKFCNVNTNPDRATIEDLKQKIIPFLKRYAAEIENYKRAIDGKPYKPGAVISEYRDQLKGAEKNLNDLTMMVNTITGENFKDVEKNFEDIQEQEKEIKSQFSNVKNQIDTEQKEKENKIKAEQEAERQIQLQKQSQERQTQAQNSLNMAQNTDDPIMKAMYLANAKTYALASGNKALANEIDQEQKQFQQAQNEVTKAQIEKSTSDINSLIGSQTNNIVNGINSINVSAQKISFSSPTENTSKNISTSQVKKKTATIDDYDFEKDKVKNAVGIKPNESKPTQVTSPTPVPSLAETPSSSVSTSSNITDLSDEQAKNVLDFIFGSGTASSLGNIDSQDKKMTALIFKDLIQSSCDIAFVKGLVDFENPDLLSVSKLVFNYYKDTKFCDEVKGGKYYVASIKTVQLKYRTYLDNRKLTGEWLY